MKEVEGYVEFDGDELHDLKHERLPDGCFRVWPNANLIMGRKDRFRVQPIREGMEWEGKVSEHNDMHFSDITIYFGGDLRGKRIRLVVLDDGGK